MSIGIRVAKIRLLDTRQSFRLGAEHRLEPDEWPELATHRFCLPQTEPVDHLIASAPYVDYLDPSTEYAIPISKTLWSHSSAYAKEACTNDHRRCDKLPTSRLTGHQTSYCLLAIAR